MTQPIRSRKVQSPETARKTQVLAPSWPMVAVVSTASSASPAQ